MAKFMGISTVDKVRAPYTLTGSALIKRDLLNEFYTRRGERVMRPNYGSLIWDLLMDPSTPELEQAVRDDIKNILSRDPRVEHIKTSLYVLDNSLRAEIDIKFLPLGNVEQLYLAYTRDLTEGVD